MSENPKSDISEWYAGRSVLVTGATGFMGKVLVEKLLRSCPKLRKIYILIRTKKGIAPDQRLQKEILNAEVRTFFYHQYRLFRDMDFNFYIFGIFYNFFYDKNRSEYTIKKF